MFYHGSLGSNSFIKQRVFTATKIKYLDTNKKDIDSHEVMTLKFVFLPFIYIEINTNRSKTTMQQQQ